jgi:hypothetical protein
MSVSEDRGGPPTYAARDRQRRVYGLRRHLIMQNSYPDSILQVYFLTTEAPSRTSRQTL